MLNKLKTKSVLTTIAFAISSGAIGSDYKISLSLETGPNHIRNISIKEWVKEVEKETKGKLKVSVYDGASKFKGSAVPTALAQGTLDMGVPGTWHLTKFIPDFGVIFTPVFFGLEADSMYKVMDGEVGKELIRKTEKKLGVKIIGRFIDVGGTLTFTKNNLIKTPDDYEGNRIRIAGSVAHARRYEYLGANAVKISWPDVPQALQTDMIDGVMTAFESVRSAKLWDSGIKYAYIDNQSYHQYVPMINLKLWNSFPDDIKNAITSTWEKQINLQRLYTYNRNLEAISVAQENGIKVTVASPDDLKLMRNKMYKHQKELIDELGIDENISSSVESVLN